MLNSYDHDTRPRPCPVCRGGTSEFTCPDCRGYGYSYDVEGNVEDCDRCHGDGYLAPDECSYCINGIVDSDDSIDALDDSDPDESDVCD